jgi:ferric-dicitrate binding protein FerR (iron transport regulator)
MIEMLDTTKSPYQAGACNIGPAEIRRRQQAGWVGLIATVAMAAVLLAVNAPDIARLAVALPAFMAFTGFLQAHLRFCAGFGLAGMENFGELGSEQKVQATEARAADRRRALQLFAAAALGAAAVGIAFFLLPL